MKTEPLSLASRTLNSLAAAHPAQAIYPGAYVIALMVVGLYWWYDRTRNKSQTAPQATSE